jgi:WD40 repeat protein/tRNA A-37 threonylcarbamoyl transferase component Bud32
MTDRIPLTQPDPSDSDLDDLPPLPATVPSPASLDGSTVPSRPQEPLPQEPPPPPAPLEPQESPAPDVPGYEILGELGRGQFGVVYKARHLALNRVVALKLIRDSELADGRERERFRAEAETVARLHRPDIVQIHDIGSGRGRLPYLALEFVEGGTLAQKIRGTPQRPAEAAELVEKLARAMHAVHERGILHRDLKPSNVLLDGHGQPKISDFGLARRLSHDDGSLPTGLMGTACYMPPEQALVQSTALRATADVYALGAILYEMLTGRPPFLGETTLDTLQQVIKQYPVAPSRLQPKVPGELEVICLKCLEKEPQRRYASAAELADDLTRFRKNEPIVARPAGSLTRAWRWCQRNPVVAASLAVVALAWISATVVSAYFAVSEHAESGRRLKAEQDLEERNQQLEAYVQELKDTNKELRKERRLGDHLLYAATMHTIRRALENGDTKLAQALLDHGGFGEAVHGFEWHYVRRVFANHLRSIQAHGSEVTALSISADGRRVASGTARNDRSRPKQPAEVRVWDLESGKAADTDTRVTAVARWDAAEALQFAEDKTLLVGCAVQVISLKDNKDPAELPRPENMKAWNCVAFHPGGRRGAMAASVSAQNPTNPRRGMAEIYGFTFSPDTGVAVLEPVLQSDRIAEPVALAYATGPPLLACGHGDGVVEVWNYEARRIEVQFRGRAEKEPADVLAVSPDGRRVATADGMDIRVHDLADGSLRVLKGHFRAVTSLAFHPDNRHLASASDDMTLRIWDLDRQRPPKVYDGHKKGLTRVAVSPDGTRVVTGDKDGHLMVWNPQAPPAVCVLGDAGGPLRGVSWAPSGKYLAAGFAPQRDTDQCPPGIVLIEALTGRILRRLGEEDGYVRHLSFHPKRPVLAAVFAGDLIRLWDAETGLPLEGLPRVADACACAFHPDGQRLVVVLPLEPLPNTGQAEVRFYDLRTGKYNSAGPHQPHIGHATPRYGRFVLAVSPDGKWLATGKGDGTVAVWDATTGQARPPFAAHGEPVTALAFDATGTRLISAGGDRVVKVWDWGKKELLLTCRGHTSAIEGVTIHPNGGWLATCSEDFTVKTWDADTGLELFTLKGHALGVTGLAYDPDGHRLATVSKDGTVRLWDGQPPPKAK